MCTVWSLSYGAVSYIFCMCTHFGFCFKSPVSIWSKISFSPFDPPPDAYRIEWRSFALSRVRAFVTWKTICAASGAEERHKASQVRENKPHSFVRKWSPGSVVQKHGGEPYLMPLGRSGREKQTFCRVFNCIVLFLYTQSCFFSPSPTSDSSCLSFNSGRVSSPPLFSFVRSDGQKIHFSSHLFSI